MKKNCLRQLLVSVTLLASSCSLFAFTQGAASTVLMQQQKFVSDLIDHCKKRAPLVVPSPVKSSVIDSLGVLQTFLNQHPEALECVIDTLTECVNAKCLNAPDLVDVCINSYTTKDISSINTQEIQQKLSALVVCYFNFQLTVLGTIDNYVEELLQKTNMDAYIELTKPFTKFIGVYITMHMALKALSTALLVDASKTSPENVPTKTPAFPVVNSMLGELVKDLNSTAVKGFGAFMLTHDLKASLNKVSTYISENMSASYAQLISKSRKSGYRAKPSKESFNSVQGYDEIKLRLIPLIDYCTHLKQYRAADLKIARGYLFEGDLNSGRKMSHAIAGEMSKKLAQAGSKTEWLVYEIHSSALVKEGALEKILNECLEFGPTVLIINNLDWIYSQQDVEVQIYADIINKLARYLAQDSALPILLCATSEDHHKIDPVMLEVNKLELIKLTEERQ